MGQTKRNYTLDLIRGVSAIIVMSGHLRNAMFKDFAELDAEYSTSVLERTFYFITSLGHQAVMVFFVLSGYFVGGSVLKSRNRFSFKNYAIARLSRLWTPLIPILFLTLIFDYYTGVISIGILDGNHYSTLNSGPTADYSISPLTFFSNVFFLQTVYTPVYGSNGPLWSLAYEFWYYILFPLTMIFTGIITRKPIVKILTLILTFLIISYISFDMMQGFLVWCIGVVVTLIAERKLPVSNTWFFVISTLLFLFSLVNSKLLLLGVTIGEYSDIIVGISFSVFLISIIHFELPNLGFLNLKKISFWISEISYTLYISHFPIVILIYGLFYSNGKSTVNLNSILQYLGWLSLIMFLTAGLWYLFERNTPVVRQKLKSIFKLF